MAIGLDKDEIFSFLRLHTMAKSDNRPWNPLVLEVSAEKIRKRHNSLLFLLLLHTTLSILLSGIDKNMLMMLLMSVHCRILQSVHENICTEKNVDQMEDL